MTGPVFEFLQTFERHFARGGGPNRVRTPWSYVESWEEFVTSCEEGYGWNQDEYKYDSDCREVLERTLYAPEMDPFPEQIQAMKERVFAADERLRNLFIPGVQIGYPDWEWWERGVLRNGIGDYAEDVKQSWGIDLANPPDPMRQ